MSPPSSCTDGRMRISSNSLIICTTSESSSRIVNESTSSSAPSPSFRAGSPIDESRSGFAPHVVRSRQGHSKRASLLSERALCWAHQRRSGP
eukprot:scaffold18246_cov36-Tisochrysis_lutea.AAC.1